jgi:hypothetical protein
MQPLASRNFGAWTTTRSLFTSSELTGPTKNATASLAFRQVTPADLLGFVLRAHQAGEVLRALRQFREWISQRKGTADAPAACNSPN